MNENQPANYKTGYQATHCRAQRPIRHLDLFSGIGGFALAAQWVGGIETIGFCEIDPWAQKVLNKNFPNVPMHDDVRTLKPTKQRYGRIDLITGGYPCQPFSEAGKRKGEEDPRHLWPQMFRIIKQARPRWVLAENVVGHITMGLDSVLHDLESEGYTARAVVIPACSVDSPHRRDRVWILANAKSKRCSYGDDGENKRKTYREKHSSSNEDRPICGLEEGRWACEPTLPRVANGIPDRVDRNRGLGNAIVPQVAAEILRVMITAD